MTAARSTDGSGRATSTNPTTQSAPTTSSPRARTPAQRARSSTEASTSVRLVPDTAVRCVSPAVRKSSVTSVGSRSSSPVTNAGTSASE